MQSSEKVPGQPNISGAERAAWLALLALTMVAFGLRFFRLAETPPGLYFDEAFNGLDATRLLSKPLGEWPIFFTGNFGREPLFIWLLALAHRLNGLSIWTIRSVSALCGALLTPALAWLGWELAPHLNVQQRRPFALWCGAAVLGLLWSQIFARYGIRLVLFVLLETLLWAALWRAWNQVEPTRSRIFILAWPWWVLTGILAGLSFYTYLPARLIPLVFVPLLPVAFWQERARLRASLPGALLAGVVAAAVAAPLGIYFIQNPVSFFTRVDQVSVIGRENGFWENLWPVLGMFTGAGDLNPRSNLPGRPVLDLLFAPFFVFGSLLALIRIRRLGDLFVLAGAGVMLLPTLLSDFAPNFQRAIGALPFAVLLVTVGLARAVQFGMGRWNRASPLLFFGAWMVIAGSVGLTARVYFVGWARLPDLYPAWDVGFTQLADQIRSTQDGVRTYITPRGKAHPTLTYLLTEEPRVTMPEGFDGRICLRVATDGPARYYVLVNEDFRGGVLLQDYLPEATVQTALTDMKGAPWADRIEQPPGGPVRFPEMTPASVPLADGIELMGYWLSLDQLRPGDRLYTRLFWKVNQTPRHAYTAFVHLLQRNEDDEFLWLAGVDRPPGDGTCPTTEWLPGEVVVDELQFVIPDLPAGQLYLAVGFYTPEDGQRLSVPGSRDDSVLIGPLR